MRPFDHEATIRRDRDGHERRVSLAVVRPLVRRLQHEGALWAADALRTLAATGGVFFTRAEVGSRLVAILDAILPRLETFTPQELKAVSNVLDGVASYAARCAASPPRLALNSMQVESTSVMPIHTNPTYASGTAGPTRTLLRLIRTPEIP